MKKLTMKTLLVGSIAASMLSGSILQVSALGDSNSGTVLDNPAAAIGNNGTGEHVITLITGDVVKVTTLKNGKYIINVEPAKKDGDGVRVMTIGEDTFVFPNSTMPYLAAGKLDGLSLSVIFYKGRGLSRRIIKPSSISPRKERLKDSFYIIRRNTGPFIFNGQ